MYVNIEYANIHAPTIHHTVRSRDESYNVLKLLMDYVNEPSINRQRGAGMRDEALRPTWPNPESQAAYSGPVSQRWTKLPLYASSRSRGLFGLPPAPDEATVMDVS